jgi:hypothetical protein
MLPPAAARQFRPSIAGALITSRTEKTGTRSKPSPKNIWREAELSASPLEQTAGLSSGDIVTTAADRARDLNRKSVMLELIEGLPVDVLGIEAVGKVTHEDYRKVLIHAAEAKMVQGPISMLYVAGPDFAGYELEALWDDSACGLKHWHHFRRIAVVTENIWLRSSIAMFCPFLPAETRLFKLTEPGAAKDWITRKEKAGA